MTIKELIEELQKYPQNIEIQCSDTEVGRYPIEEFVYEEDDQHKDILVLY